MNWEYEIRQGNNQNDLPPLTTQSGQIDHPIFPDDAWIRFLPAGTVELVLKDSSTKSFTLSKPPAEDEWFVDSEQQHRAISLSEEEELIIRETGDDTWCVWIKRVE